jgi:hypothetical protein
VVPALLLGCAGLLGAGLASTNDAALEHRFGDEIRGRVVGACVSTSS